MTSGPRGDAPAQGQHRTTLRWWRIITICCWLPCRCHVGEGDKAVSIDTAHARLRQRQCQPAPTLRVRARWQKKPGLTKQRIYKIMICRWPRWLSTSTGVEKSLVLIYSYRFVRSILQSCDALSHPRFVYSNATSARMTKPYRSLQRTTGSALSASTWQSQVFVIANDHCLCLRRLFSIQRQFLCLFCECRLDDKESQANLFVKIMICCWLSYSDSSKVSTDLNSRWLVNDWTYSNSPRTNSYTLRKSVQK